MRLGVDPRTFREMRPAFSVVSVVSLEGNLGPSAAIPA